MLARFIAPASMQPGGAGGNVGAEAAARSSPDGYIIVLAALR
jgi:tripartite-type tricarboxylate transporter receptor subunit TctC